MMNRRNLGLAFTMVAVAVSMTPASAQDATAPTPVGNPGAWIRPDDYPPDAIRGNRMGRVVAQLAIDPDGRVVSCTIRTSSGTTSLDERTCQIATTRGSFNPATDAKGHKIAGTFTLPVNWKIPNTVTVVDLSSGPIRTDTEFEQVIGADGTLVACNLQTPVQPQQIDPCTRLVIGSMTHSRFVRDGKPVGAVVRQRFTSTITSSGTP